jgi:uncharacterized RDD family membrane protein YckC
MRWLWFVAPLVLLASYLAIVLTSTMEDARRTRALNRWLDELLGPLVSGKKSLRRRVRALPDRLIAMVEAAGGGARVADIVLVPELAYVAVRAADGATASSHHTVICKLKKPAPKFVCRPLPIIDGRPLENRGLAVDEEFCESFVVEGDDIKGVRTWLDSEVRATLYAHPDVWLRTQGDVMAVTLYGPIDADQLDELVATTDALYAKYGASSKSLFGDGRAAAGGLGLEKGGAVVASAPPNQGRPGKKSDVAEGEVAAPDLRIKAGAIDLGLNLVAVFVLALVNGSFESFHPAGLFNSPDVVVNEPWQGGFTTKGIGAFTAALILVVGLFTYQSYLAANHGRSIGKWIVGLKVVRNDDGPVDFAHGVVLRSWLFGAVVLAVAATLTRPFSMGALFPKLLTFAPLATLGGLILLGVATFSRDRDQRGIHDRLADTKVVEAVRVRVPGIQLAATRGMDPVVFGQVARVLGLIGLHLVALFAVYAFDIKLGFLPQQAMAVLIFIPVIVFRLARAATR